MDTTATLGTFRALPMEDRLDLDQVLADSWTPTINDELKAELERRWANYRANPASGLTWEQVVAHVRGA